MRGGDEHPAPPPSCPAVCYPSALHEAVRLSPASITATRPEPRTTDCKEFSSSVSIITHEHHGDEA